MSDRTLSIKITAEDGASKIFQAVGDSAQALGDIIEDIASEGGDVFEDVSASAAEMGQAVESAATQGSASLQKMGKDAQDVAAAMSTVGKTIAGFGATMMAAVAVPITAGSKAAWQQVDAVQQATIALRTYEKDASKVDKVLQSLIGFARSDPGRLFNRTELFQAAQGLKVMGAETDNLSEYVQIMARSVAIGAGTWDELGQVIGRVGSTGQLTGVEFDNLTKMGFQLDASLRNTTVTWEELFAALDSGIGMVEGQTETIQGAMTMLQSSIRGLGLAFLQVDSETSQFIEGGLGDQLYQGLGRAREAFTAMQPAAAAFGDAAAVVARGAGTIADAFLSLPQGVQTAGFMMTGIAGAALTLGGSLMMLAPRIVATRAAMQTLGGVSGIARLGLTGLVGAINPLTLGLAAAALAGVGLYKIFQNVQESASGVAEGVGLLTDEIERLKLAAQPEAAQQVQEIVDVIEAQIELLSGDMSDLIANGIVPPGTDFLQITSPGGLSDQVKTAGQLMDEFSAHVIETANSITDPAARQAYLDWVNDLLTTIEHTADGTNLDDIITTVLLTPASEVPGVMAAIKESAGGAANGLADLGQQAEEAAASVSMLRDIFADMPATLDDLRLDGQGGLARDFEDMAKSIEDAFVIDAPVNPLSPLGIGTTAGEITQTLELTESQLGSLESAWDRVWNGMESGVLDNTALMADWNAILADSTLTDAEKVASLGALSTSLANYYDSAKAMQEQQVEFLADGDNILDWWLQYQGQLRNTMAAYDDLHDAAEKGTSPVKDYVSATEAAFESSVNWALGMNAASAALDQALRTFQQIDTIAQRSASAGSIAENLVGEPGVWHEIDDMLQQGIISLEEYNTAVTAGHEIQWSNVRVQEMLNQVRRDQLPLLNEAQQAYESNIEYLTTLEPLEQRRALMLQDSAIQSEVAAQYSLAYAASIGEIPPEVATEMIVNTAKADPAMADLLEQFGLIEIGAEGEITVNFPDADATIGAINRMTLAFLYFQAVAEGIEPIELAAKIYGQEEADALFATLEEHDGTTTTIDVAVETSQLDTVEVGVIPVWEGTVTGGDGTGGAMGPPGMESITVPVTGQITEITGMPEAGDGSSLIDGLAQDVQITVTQVGMEAVIGLAQATQNAIEGVPTSWVTAVSETGAAGVIGLAQATQNAIEDIPTDWNTDITMTGVETAIGNAHAIANAINEIPTDRTSTISVVTAYSSTGTPPVNRLHGGIPGFASGGVPFWGAEAGPELLHFATGGTAPIFREGAYAVPPMTYVSPANANPGLGQGGMTVQVHVHGNVYGVDDLVAEVVDPLAMRLGDELARQRVAAGV